jgi:hypothetical protein
MRASTGNAVIAIATAMKSTNGNRCTPGGAKRLYSPPASSAPAPNGSATPAELTAAAVRP